MITQETVNTLRAIQHMLRTDDHTRTHWAFWTVMYEMDAYMRQHFEEQGLEPPCGAVGCAWGHAYRLGIIATGAGSFAHGHEVIGLSKGDFDYIFENTSVNENSTPDDVADRIDLLLERHEIAPVLHNEVAQSVVREPVTVE